MSLLYRILYAAHANGTHHKLALQGLSLMRGSHAEAWRRLFLSRAEALLEGSKAPDKQFKDFQNHCLHVADDPAQDWGGAMRSAEEWYAETVQALARGDWSEAAYAAGVLSHYYTDPLMPFHTGSSDAESVIHRAAEWSVSKSFERLWADATPATLEPAAFGDGWVGAMVREGAGKSAAYYQTLIDHYDFEVGAKQPERGFDPTANRALSELLAYAAAGFARLLERAVIDSGAKAPNVDLTVQTVVAGLKIPVKWVLKKIEDEVDRAEVSRIYEEFAETGKVEVNLPQENRVVRKLKGQEDSQEIAALKSAVGPERMAERQAEKAKSASKGRGRGRAPRLSRDDVVEKAPSIGPKTAARLETIGVVTVGDLLDAEPKKVAEGLGDRRITAKTVTQWRDQARLLTRAPGLKTSHAVMLAACGYRDVEAIAQAEPNFLREQMAAVSIVDPVKRQLRGAPPPELAEVQEIVSKAQGLLEAA